MLDVGPFTSGLEFALEVRAELVGKPAAAFFQTAIDDMGLSPQSVIMIGDDIVGDVEGAQKSGMRGLLVRTGKFQPSDEKHPVVTPDAIVDDLAQAVEFIFESR
jgi:phospholysine phosphohistidine inorganic pyrophosphate phosphatase